MHRPSTPSTRKRRVLTATVAVATLTGSALLAPPSGAQDAAPAEVPPAPEPQPPVETPPTTPPTTPPIVPVEPPTELPAIEVPPVRSELAVDVPAAPVTELPLAPDPGPSSTPAPRSDEPATPPDAPHQQPTQRRAAAETPRTVPKAPPDARASSTTVAAAPPPSQHTVVAGEHLWSIAAAQVAAATGRASEHVSAVEVAPYWTQLCMLNAARLRSGDLNLVYAGEVLDLPVR